MANRPFLDRLNLADVQAMENVEQESSVLEFKRGAALARDGNKPAELVKDVTGMANAAGGRIIYGIEEIRQNNIVLAGALSPIVDNKITADWLSQVVKTNSAPPLRD